MVSDTFFYVDSGWFLPKPPNLKVLNSALTVILLSYHCIRNADVQYMQQPLYIKFLVWGHFFIPPLLQNK